MIRRYFYCAAFFIFFIQMVSAQESLGDLARKLKAEKSNTQSTPTKASPAKSQAAPATPASAPATVTGNASGQQQPSPAWSAVSAAATAPPAVVPDLSPDMATDIHGLEKYRAAIDQLFAQEKFEELDRISHEARATKARFSGGNWKIEALYHSLYIPRAGDKASDAEWQQNLGRLERWMQQRPTSITARVALGWLYVNYGWHARGGDYAGSVTDEGWRLLEERTEMAKKILEDAQSLPEKCPEWYSAMLSIAVAQSWDPEQSQALFEKAVAFEPEYYPYYQDRAENYLPKWGGEEGDTAAFAEAAANRVGGKKGDAIYFYIAAKIICACDNQDRLNGMSWERIKRGYSANEELYGRSMGRLNRMAYMCAMGGDYPFADSLFPLIKDNFAADIWNSREEYETARMTAHEVTVMTHYKEAVANSTSPEGSFFATTLTEAINKKYHAKLMDCMKSVPDYPSAQVGMLIRLGKDGKPQQILFSPSNAPSGCFQPQVEKDVFSAPPHADYWVAVLMDVKK
jgi:Domain of unknown function (DUF4034)